MTTRKLTPDCDAALMTALDNLPTPALLALADTNQNATTLELVLA